jgi:hypothetical protein
MLIITRASISIYFYASISGASMIRSLHGTFAVFNSSCMHLVAKTPLYLDYHLAVSEIKYNSEPDIVFDFRDIRWILSVKIGDTIVNPIKADAIGRVFSSLSNHSLIIIIPFPFGTEGGFRTYQL